MGYRIINNRKKTKGRLVRQVIVFTSEYMKLRESLSYLVPNSELSELRIKEINNKIFDSRGKIRKSIYKNLYVENTQKSRTVKSKEEVINKE